MHLGNMNNTVSSSCGSDAYQLDFILEVKRHILGFCANDLQMTLNPHISCCTRKIEYNVVLCTHEIFLYQNIP